MDKIQKFLNILTAKELRVLLPILEDIKSLRLSAYDVKVLKGHKGLFRLRKGKIRIVFVKMTECGVIINIAYRKDIYK